MSLSENGSATYRKRYFGTDGIRGVYGETLTDNIARLVGNALAGNCESAQIVLGRDNRVSGGRLSAAITDGVAKAGGRIIDLGIVSTPCVAFVTSLIGADYGIVVSASHNTWQYNGIKIFDGDGKKLDAATERYIEDHVSTGIMMEATSHQKSQKGTRLVADYIEYLAKIGGDLSGLRIVLDCANGAVSRIAPKLFERLGADVISFNTSRSGSLINKGCGATHTEFLSKAVISEGADIGFCFDGDADRVLAADSDGKIVDGDSIIYIIAKHMKSKDSLSGNAAVGTLHTNMGVEKALKDLGIELLRTDIGDHNVMEKMREQNLLVGGEQSGHIILREFAGTGDGVLAALYLSRLIKETGFSFSVLDDVKKYPQCNINIKTENKDAIAQAPSLKQLIKDIESELDGRGRILVRASGTEPLLRIMTECATQDLSLSIAKNIEQCILNNYKL